MMGIEEKNQIILEDTNMKEIKEKFETMKEEIVAMTKKLTNSTGIGAPVGSLGLKWDRISQTVFKLIEEGEIKITPEENDHERVELKDGQAIEVSNSKLLTFYR